MTQVYSDDWLTIHQGDCREVMAGMEPESVNCVVTSPPYWGLRDYGTAQWFGGNPDCDHKPVLTPRSKRPAGWLTGGKATVDAGTVKAGDCARCGAQRQDRQFGLEATPEEYVANMVDVFRDVRRVLRPDGTLWLNLGDSYASSPSGVKEGGVSRSSGLHGAAGLSPRYRETLAAGHGTKRNTVVGSLKPKDLVGIPWRVAFALQADGWYLRSDIIWSKPNPMPESVTDRPTKAHEYVFLLSKSPRYYFDAEAVREAALHAGEVVSLGTKSLSKGQATGMGREASGNGKADSVVVAEGRNLRSVWTVATQPYPGAHFATFPEKLIEPPIKAGCPENGVVLDPFGGSGTVGRVANRLSRRAVLIDLNGDYVRQQFDRNRELPLGLTGEPAA